MKFIYFQIGLMRGGYLLAEESPERLITQFNAQSLEDVFLKLSVIQNMGKRRRSSIAQGVTEAITVPTGVVNEGKIKENISIYTDSSGSCFYRMKQHFSST